MGHSVCLVVVLFFKCRCDCFLPPSTVLFELLGFFFALILFIKIYCDCLCDADYVNISEGEVSTHQIGCAVALAEETLHLLGAEVRFSLQYTRSLLDRAPIMFGLSIRFFFIIVFPFSG